MDIKSHGKHIILGLNSLRFIFFLLILQNHIYPDTQPISYGRVDFFFVLTGLLMGYLALKELKDTGTFSQHKFFFRRMLRIYPLYFLILIISFFALPLLRNITTLNITLPTDGWKYWIFIGNTIQMDHVFALRFLWSISVSEQFIFFFLICSFSLKRFKLFIPLLLLTLYFIGDQFENWWASGFFSYADSFGIGVLGGYFYYHYYNRIKKLWIFIAFICSLVLCFVFLEHHYFSLFLSIFYACLILLTVSIANEINTKNPVWKMTEFMGKYTYGLYLFSGFVITFQRKFLTIDHPWLVFLFNLTIIIALAIPTYHIYESPFLRLKKYFR